MADGAPLRANPKPATLLQPRAQGGNRRRCLYQRGARALCPDAPTGEPPMPTKHTLALAASLPCWPPHRPMPPA